MSAATTAACGCCTGVSQRTPLEVQNRPGLSAVAYRVGVHDDFLASLIAGLTDAGRLRLKSLGTRDSDDFTIALLDAWAVTADVLAFYSERLQQESYLRTARERISLQEIGRLIGYRLRPGLAAETYVAFALEPPPDVPATATKDPGSAPPVTPATVTLETGLRLQSIPSPGEQPQTFEMVEEIEARPRWNAMPAAQTRSHAFKSGDTVAHLLGAALDLKPGDALLLAGANGVEIANQHWNLRTLTKVATDPEHKRTCVEWAEGLGAPSPATEPEPVPTPFVLRKRINVFGHNAPRWYGMSAAFRLDYLHGGSDPGDWPNFLISDAGSNIVDLDGSHPDVVAGSYVVLSQPGLRDLWKVEEVSELARADFAISGKVTRLKLKGGAHYADFQKKPRGTTVLAVSDPLKLAEEPNPDAVALDSVDVDTDVSALAAGRRLIVRGETAAGKDTSEVVTVKAVQAVGSKWRIQLAGNLSTAYKRTTAIVYGNVALASHGETVRQLLGSGRARDPFQRFTLAHEPLTYLSSTTDPSGGEAALEVRVNDVRWDEVPTLYGAGPRDRAYAVRTDEAGKTYVQFGDGERGSRLPTGSNNVRATYRKGLGSAGNVEPGALALLLDRPLGVKGVSNSAAAAGGVDAEAEEAARTSIPLGARTLGRAVSLLDYEDYARGYTGVVKARAAVLPLRGGKTIVVSVAFSGGNRLGDLATSLRTHGDPRVEVVVLEGTTAKFRLALKVAVDPAYETDAVLDAVETALRAAYSFEARGFVEPVFRSEVIAVAHTVAGVLAVDVDRLYAGTSGGLADRLLAQPPAVDPGGTAIPAGVLVLAETPFDWLKAMA